MSRPDENKNEHPVVHPIPPVYRADSRILILGSFPSVRADRFVTTLSSSAATSTTWRWHLQESVCSITKKKCVLYLYKKKESGLWGAGFFLFSHMRQNMHSRNPGFCAILDTENL